MRTKQTWILQCRHKKDSLEESFHQNWILQTFNFGLHYSWPIDVDTKFSARGSLFQFSTSWMFLCVLEDCLVFFSPKIISSMFNFPKNYFQGKFLLYKSVKFSKMFGLFVFLTNYYTFLFKLRLYKLTDNLNHDYWFSSFHLHGSFK